MSLLQRFMDAWSSLNKNNIDCVDDIYASDIEFVDPFHHFFGIDEMKKYLEHMYENLISSQFQFHSYAELGEEAYLRWTMTVRHKRLLSGDPIEVMGISYLKLSSGKVIFHQDYYDGAALLYENIPVLGAIVKVIKNRAAG